MESIELQKFSRGNILILTIDILLLKTTGILVCSVKVSGTVFFYYQIFKMGNEWDSISIDGDLHRGLERQ
jgi:hypothetical protein